LIFRFFIAKNLENIRKHQIDFADVPAMFDGEMLVELDDRFDDREYRWFGIGFLGSGIAVVVWTEGQNNVIRIIISAPRANRHEQKRFEQYLWY
jgi:uncharacterized DUF497 family protein